MGRVRFQHHQRRHLPADLIGQLGVAGGVLLDAGALPGPVAGQERLGDDFPGIAI
jgi:hypothetical protein